MRLVALRHVGPYHKIGSAFGALMEWARNNGIEHGYPVSIYYDDPQSTPPAELRSDACVEVAEGVTVEDPFVRMVEVPSNTYAVYTYVGPYQGIGDAWQRFMTDWYASSGYTYGEGVCYEKYMNDDKVTPSEELITELYLPVKLG